MILLLTLSLAATQSWSGSSDFGSGSHDDTVVDGSNLTLDSTSNWYDTNWAYRTPITVSENSGTDLSDYSVELTLDTASMISAGTLNSDGSDLRFTDSSGNLVGHWVESSMNSSSTVIWVRVPSITASSTATIYAYHGYSSASDVSDKSEAMLWWDDFDSSLSGYSSQGLTGDGNEAWSTTGGFAYNTNNIYSRASLVVSSISLSDDYLVETKARTSDNDGLGLAAQVNSSGSQFYTAQSWAGSSGRSGICRNTAEGNCVASGNFTISTGSTHTYKLTSNSGTLRMYLDGTQKASYTDSSPLSAGRLGLFSSLNNPAGYFDYLLIRRYVSPEPTASVGTAETSIASPGIWTSPVLSVGCEDSSWDSASFTATTPSNTTVTIAVRSGPTATPDSSWSSWGSEQGSGSALSIADGAYAQARVTLSCSSCSSAPSVSTVDLDYTLAEDSDGDGYSSLACGGSDCDDNESTTNPGADEYCDSVDNNCNTKIDEDSAVDATTWYADSDSDGYGDASVSDVECTQPSAYVIDATDCDDTDATVHPSASELCDGQDNDCNNSLDDSEADLDGDGYVQCSVDSGGWDGSSTPGFEDCDDSDPDTWPGADEYCDGHDDDCDLDIDEDDSVDAPTWYADVDLDGYGNASLAEVTCYQVLGWVLDDTDCDDTEASVYPGASEVPYDGIDQDCDSADLCDVDGDGFDYDGAECFGEDCDDEDDAIHPDAEEIWYDDVDQDCAEDSDYDADGDGYDSASYGGEDCDDGNPETYPGAPDEPGDGIVNDCDGADEYDADGDGYDGADYGGTDCDDANSSINPGADEQWYDGVDQDCDGNDDDQDEDGWSVDEDCDDLDPALTDDCGDSGGVLDTGLMKGGGGCGCGGGAPVSGLVLLLGFLGCRRRRTRSA